MVFCGLDFRLRPFRRVRLSVSEVWTEMFGCNVFVGCAKRNDETTNGVLKQSLHTLTYYVCMCIYL